jgi:hypothetical protein
VGRRRRLTAGMNTHSCWALVPVVVALGLVMTGCSTTSTPTATTTRTVTATSTPQPSTNVTATPTSGATTGTGTGTGAEGAAPNPQAAMCTTSHLKGEFAGETAGASNVDEELQLTNTGTNDCTLQGWPGVSLVGHGNGTQIGKAAVFDRTTTHATVALKPGTAAVAHFHYVQADAFTASTCKPITGDGFRVYPPGSKTSLFIPAKVRGCTAGNETIFTVGAFH